MTKLEVQNMFKKLSAALVAMSLVAVAEPALAQNTNSNNKPTVPPAPAPGLPPPSVKGVGSPSAAEQAKASAQESSNSQAALNTGVTGQPR